MTREDATNLFDRVIRAFAASEPLMNRCEVSLVYVQPPGMYSVSSWKVRVQSGLSMRVYLLHNEQSWQECKRELGIEE